VLAVALILAAGETVSNGSTGLDTATVIALITAGVGVAGVILTALKYNQERTARAIESQSKIVADMKTLMEAQGEALDEAEAERDEALEELERLKGAGHERTDEVGEPD